jgi:predicted small secreted protein
MRNLILVILAFTALAGLSACNTVEGMGRDIEGAGQSIQKL